MNPLQQLYENKPMLLAVQESIRDTLKRRAVDKLLKGEDATGIAEAIKAVDDWLGELRDEFDTITKATTTNQAR